MAPQLFKHKEFNFEKLGIGGLDIQFEQIFRRAFASRVFPPAVVERLGIRHVKVGLNGCLQCTIATDMCPHQLSLGVRHVKGGL